MQQDLVWERAKNNRIAQEQIAALARVEEKIAKALQSTQNLEELKATVTLKFQEARTESVSTTFEIRMGIRNLLRDVHPDQPPRNASRKTKIELPYGRKQDST